MKIVCTDIRNKLISAVFDKNKIECLAAEGYSPGMEIGSIYVGRVENCILSLKSAFVRFSGSEVGYLPFSDVPSGALFNREFNAGDVLRNGDMLAVQLKRLKSDMKQPRLSACLTSASRYAAVSFGKSGVSASKKLDDRSRKELVENFNKFVSESPDDVKAALRRHSVIFRSESSGLYKKDNDIASAAKEALSLIKRLEEIRSRASFLTAGSVVYKTDFKLKFEENLIKMYHYAQSAADENDNIEIVTDDAELYYFISELSQIKENKNTFVKLYDDERISLDALYSVSSQLDDLNKRVVWLKSGAFLVIDRTEAMTVIDVNTGKNITKKADDFLSVNLEAAKEVFRQIRLRNICGIIIVDFINMKHKASRDALIEKLKLLSGLDPVRTQFIDFTKLGLAEITRERNR